MAKKPKGRLVIKKDEHGRRSLGREERVSTKKDKRAKKARKATNDTAPVETLGGGNEKAPTSQPAAKFEAFRAAFDRWKAGEQIHALASSLGHKRSKLRRALIQLAGGKAAFKALRTDGAGGTVEAFGGKRATGGRTKEVIAQDDSKVQQLTRLDARLEHWRHEWLRTPLGNFPILVTPDGETKYGRASATERADLIVDPQTPGVPMIRMRKLDGSALARLAKQEEKTVERGEALLEQTKKRKRSARVARKARKAVSVEA
jgi:hypothetical protein